jgi:hypothetical protein
MGELSWSRVWMREAARVDRREGDFRSKVNSTLRCGKDQGDGLGEVVSAGEKHELSKWSLDYQPSTVGTFLSKQISTCNQPPTTHLQMLLSLNGQKWSLNRRF